MALGRAPRTAEQQMKMKRPTDWHRIQVFDLDAPVLAPHGLRVRDVESDPTNKRDVVVIDEPILKVFSPAAADRISLENRKASIPYDDAEHSVLVPASTINYIEGLTLELVYDPDRSADGFAGWGLNNVQGRLSLKLKDGTTVVEAAAVFQHEKPRFNPKFWQSRTTVPDGSYRLLPRPSNANGIDQLLEANHAWSWWLIDFQWQRSFNVHCGSMSEGCATVTDRPLWEEFYSRLVFGRFDLAARTHAAELTVRAESGPRKTTVIINDTPDHLAVYRDTGRGAPYATHRLPPGHATPVDFAAIGLLVPAGRGLATTLLGRYDGPIPFDARGLDRCIVDADANDVRPSATGRPGRPATDWPIIDPGNIATLPPVPGSIPTPTPSPPESPFVVDRGQLTFNAEGTEGGRFHSRRPHVPDENSGLTIGRGYDLKTKPAAQIVTDLTSAGLSQTEATRYSGAAGLHGSAAREFRDGHALVEITPQQQKELFLRSYDAAAADVRRICEKPDVVSTYGTTDFDHLNPLIRDILVDLRFRGDYSGATRQFVQPCVVANDLECMRRVMSDRSRWPNVPRDRFRRRVEYLNRTMPAPPSPNT